jgi:hypothetical protein
LIRQSGRQAAKKTANAAKVGRHLPSVMNQNSEHGFESRLLLMWVAGQKFSFDGNDNTFFWSRSSI